jgi:TonB family protein
MTGKHKNIKPALSDFLRYRENKMTNEERNAFERELQKDPFLEEALEGLSGLSPDDATADISELQSKFVVPQERKSRFIYYRIAASVTILMAISTVFILIERNRSRESLTLGENRMPAAEIRESKSLRAPAEINIPRDAARNETAPGKKEKVFDKIEPENAVQNIAQADEKTIAVKRDSIIPGKIAEPARIIAEEVMAAPSSAAARSEKANTPLITGRVISSDDLKPVPGATIVVKGTSITAQTDINGNFSFAAGKVTDKTLVATFIGMEPKEFMAKGDSSLEITLNPSAVALNEVVVVGYGVQKRADAAGAADKVSIADRYAAVEYLPAEPVPGMTAFNRYIENNIVKPDVFVEGKRVVVVLSFKVKANGLLDSIKVIRSEGKPYSDEAIRLIKEGPAWKPATDNGKAIDEEVRVRIVFK